MHLNRRCVSLRPPLLGLLVGALLGLASPVARTAPIVGSGDTATAEPRVARPGTEPCAVTLFSGYTFADFTPKSFAYSPPSACRGPWAKVVLEADFAVSAGRQFDRTATVFVGGVNIYFGTTMEPSRSLGPTWHVERDLTDYSALFSAPQSGLVNLGNLVDSTYTGILTGSAKLLFYPLPPRSAPPRTPDLVLPLSAGAAGGTVSLNTTTSTLARSFALPTNIERAYLDVYVQSQGQDEFFYTCVPSDVADKLQSCGGTSFREAEISIDGQPAGVAPVFPWIYTGGIDPYLWRPIPGVQALAFVPYRVDLTPFSARLSDGHSHEVGLRVYNANNRFEATAVLLLFRDGGRDRVRGALLRNTLSATPSPTVDKALVTAMDGSISGSVTVQSTRSFVISGYVDTSHGRVYTELDQTLGFSNRQVFDISTSKYLQNIQQSTSIQVIARVQEPGLHRETLQQQSWPLRVNFASVEKPDKSSTQTTEIGQEYESREQITDNGHLVHSRLVSNRVSPRDTLNFDARGAFLGTSGQKSTQEYLSVDSADGCYSREISAESGLVTQVHDQRLCSP